MKMSIQRQHKQTIRIPFVPITFGELINKVSFGPDTPPQFLQDLEAAGIKPSIIHYSIRKWSPNVHMEAYNARREKKK
jgi:hypothetical protein